MKEDEYELLMKKYRDEYRYKDIAQITGSSVEASKIRMHRILEKLRNSLNKTLVFFIVTLIFKNKL